MAPRPRAPWPRRRSGRGKHSLDGRAKRCPSFGRRIQQQSRIWGRIANSREFHIDFSQSEASPPPPVLPQKRSLSTLVSSGSRTRRCCVSSLRTLVRAAALVPPGSRTRRHILQPFIPTTSIPPGSCTRRHVGKFRHDSKRTIIPPRNLSGVN